jgi:hypothetical protein
MPIQYNDRHYYDTSANPWGLTPLTGAKSELWIGDSLSNGTATTPNAFRNQENSFFINNQQWRIISGGLTVSDIGPNAALTGALPPSLLTFATPGVNTQYQIDHAGDVAGLTPTVVKGCFGAGEANDGDSALFPGRLSTLLDTYFAQFPAATRYLLSLLPDDGRTPTIQAGVDFINAATPAIVTAKQLGGMLVFLAPTKPPLVWGTPDYLPASDPHPSVLGNWKWAASRKDANRRIWGY